MTGSLFRLDVPSAVRKPYKSFRHRSNSTSVGWAVARKHLMWRHALGVGVESDLNRNIAQRGNPNSGKSMLPASVLITEFDLEVRKLRLTKPMYVSSVELRRWCDHNRNRFYGSEWLLAEWGMQVEDTFSDGGSSIPRRARVRYFRAAS